MGISSVTFTNKYNYVSFCEIPAFLLGLKNGKKVFSPMKVVIFP
ncbi:hypothetical protein HMPREF0658_1417 [Hoylesella marshii DSM 16973 = JCM 13450]|uniref:Uncharacterized protein n=1 Tax=Hoylesella marshii DSM 16973 = JCM 13450 TaxID=862515 RepID=E0NTB5_9BACT|nr:hypothetical protein HMPREF0658_1417 [Hoylesella marshii DSM 16973 = JCM 13450]